MSVLDLGLNAVERGLVPDALARLGIRRFCGQRLREEADRPMADFVAAMRRGPVAPVPEKANEQHYELPPEFFGLVLGEHRKYSCCWWPEGVERLDDAEAAALEATAERAGLADGQRILELGCGWGSLTLWTAARQPRSRITAVSNSAPQRRFIEAQASARGLHNVQVITADMNRFDTDERFDRVVSVEMFEHMRNYELLLRRIAGWLRPEGRLFLHVFSHRSLAYAFETDGARNWLGRHFFTGGIMPGHDLLLAFQDDLAVERRWRWDGTHYRRTAEAWLANLDRHHDEILPILRETYGPADAPRWFRRWRVFFLACAELFGYDRGREWGVTHCLMSPRGSAGATPGEAS